MTVKIVGEAPRNLWRSAGVVLLGLVAILVLSLGTDQLLHVLEVYPPWGQPMHEPALNLLALAYRCIYAVLGCYLAAWFAPRNPMRHALVLGRDRIGVKHGRRGGHDSAGSRPGLVSNCADADRIALRLARRRSLPQNASMNVVEIGGGRTTRSKRHLFISLLVGLRSRYHGKTVVCKPAGEGS